MPETENTLSRILDSAREEFLEKGFMNASLRNIVKNAGVTTGAFYRYYESKEALFSALVDEHAAYMLNLFRTTLDDFEKLPGDIQTEKMIDISTTTLIEMLEYVYDHYDAFKLLLTCSEGTAYADFTHQLAVGEAESTYRYMETLAAMGYEVEPLHKNLVHIISSGLFSGFFETVIHDIPRDEAKVYLAQFHRFYQAGWSELLGIQFR